MSAPVVTFLTDFGTADYFVGAMKGALLAVCPSARAFDITHEIPPQNIAAGAFILLAGHAAWPAGTIHVAVVDPGVGSKRRPLAMAAGGYYFVGPDNGLFSYLYEHYPAARVRHVTDESYFRQPVSPSFHGRDVFAPVAGALAAGVEPESLGPEITDARRLAPLAPTPQPDGSLLARIIHIDHFGNCVTNLTARDLPHAQAAHGFRLEIQGQVITRACRFFAEAPTNDTLFIIYGSAGFWEISLRGASAARQGGFRQGAEARLSFV